MNQAFSVHPVPGLPMVNPGDDLAGLIVDALQANYFNPETLKRIRAEVERQVYQEKPKHSLSRLKRQLADVQEKLHYCGYIAVALDGPPRPARLTGKFDVKRPQTALVMGGGR